MRVTLVRNPSLKCRLQGVILFRSPPIRRPSLRNESDSELIVMLDGVYTAREIRAEQKIPVRAEAGDAVFWPGHVRRIEENDPDKPFRCFAIFLRWPSAPLDLPRVVPDTDGIMRYLAMQLIAIKESRTPLPAAIPNGFLSALLAEYLRRALSPPDPLEAKVLAFLSRHRTTPFTLDALARFVGLQRHHFGQAFKKRTGFSPMDYVRRGSWAVTLFWGSNTAARMSQARPDCVSSAKTSSFTPLFQSTSTWNCPGMAGLVAYGRQSISMPLTQTLTGSSAP